jgi:hypothetical protein
MRKSILHLGFHKTGTTYLQLGTQRWLLKRRQRIPTIFYSSQHAPSSGWLQVRTQSFQRLRNTIAKKAQGDVPDTARELESRLAELGVAGDFKMLCEHFSRRGDVLIHSDENSLGDVFGHCGYGPNELWPFYPNGAWLCAVFAAAAGMQGGDVHLILTIRDFSEMAISSFKTAVRSRRPVPAVNPFIHNLSDISTSCRTILEQSAQLKSVHAIHILDYAILQRSPLLYFDVFRRLISDEPYRCANPAERINESLSDSHILDLLVKRGVISTDQRSKLTNISELIPPERLGRLAADYRLLQSWLAAMQQGESRLRYYC